MKDSRNEAMLKGMREQNSAWVHDQYLTDRQKVMLTFSDARNCTFIPDVRQPREGRTFEKWLDGWGEDFKKKKPLIYKLGTLKRVR